MLAIIKYHIFCNADSDIPNKSLKYNIQKKQDKHQRTKKKFEKFSILYEFRGVFSMDSPKP